MSRLEKAKKEHENKQKDLIYFKRRIILYTGIIAILSAIIFIAIILNKPEVEQQITSVPDVNLENTEIKISDIEITCDDIIIEIGSKLDEFNLYYCINEIETEEMEDNKESTEEREKNEYILYENALKIEQNSIVFLKYELEGLYSENPYIIEINNIEKEAEESESATEEELEEEKVKEKDNNAKYYIKVNYTANVVTVYSKDDKGEYTVPVKAMVCSSGTATPTSGVYKISDKYRWRLLFGNVYGQYATRIVGSILFHSVPYIQSDPSTLEYWEYDKLGTRASLGCIRLTVADALWIYNNCEKGTQVEFYSSSTSGPLGKPSAQKISGNEKFRGWDPTDPLDNNPWKTGIVQEDTSKDKVENQVIENNNMNTNTNTNTNVNIDTDIGTNDTNTNTNTNTNNSENTDITNEIDEENNNIIENIIIDDEDGEDLSENIEDEDIIESFILSILYTFK